MARAPVPGPVVIPNTAEVKYKFAQQNEIMSIVCHGMLTAAGPLNPGIAESIFSSAKSQTGVASYLALCHPTFSFVGVEVKDLRNANNPTLESSGVALVGSGTGGYTSQGSALVITKRTDRAGKEFTGRAYLVGWTVTEMANSRNWLDTTGAAGVAAMDGFNSAQTSQQLPMVLAQRALQAGTTSSGAALPARAAGNVPISGFIARDLRIDSQRRRLGR